LLAIFLIKRWRSAGFDAAGAHGVHEVSDIEPRFDVFGGIKLASRIQSMGILIDNFRSQWDVSGDD
jgi:hypothetical protein